MVKLPRSGNVKEKMRTEQKETRPKITKWLREKIIVLNERFYELCTVDKLPKKYFLNYWQGTRRPGAFTVREKRLTAVTPAA